MKIADLIPYTGTYIFVNTVSHTHPNYFGKLQLYTPINTPAGDDVIKLQPGVCVDGDAVNAGDVVEKLKNEIEEKNPSVVINLEHVVAVSIPPTK